jgi:sugar phosphate isomerase/epimerase
MLAGDLARSLGEPSLVKKLNGLKGRHQLPIPSLAMVDLCIHPSLIGRSELAQTAIRQVRRGLETAAAIGAGVLLLPFFGKNLIETEPELNNAAEALAQLAEPAEQAGVILGVESTLNVHQQLFLLGQTGHSPNVRIYFDTGNSLARKYDVATQIRDLGLGTICQVHFKDVRIAEGAHPAHDVALGTGSVDFRAVVGALRACRYDGWIVLETPPGADPLAATRANIAFAREALAAGESA